MCRLMEELDQTQYGIHSFVWVWEMRSDDNRCISLKITGKDNVGAHPKYISFWCPTIAVISRNWMQI